MTNPIPPAPDAPTGSLSGQSMPSEHVSHGVLVPSPFKIAAWACAAALMLIVVKFGLIAPLLAGMTMYAGVTRFPLPFASRIDTVRERQVALAIVSSLIIGALLALGFWTADLLQGQKPGAGLPGLMLRASEIVLQIREFLPEWATKNWPRSVSSFNAWVGEFLRAHSSDLQVMSQDVLHTLTRMLIGLILGGFLAVAVQGPHYQLGPLGLELKVRAENFFRAFRQVFFAQLKISALNTFFTGIFLMGVLPLIGMPIPFAKTLLLVTFVAGLIPVLGNLISNTFITLIALSVSPLLAAVCLGYLVVIHKLEYFLNARIVGGEIRARAWELLVAMLVMEALFGLPGVVAAPIFYAYVKDELKAMGWI